MLQDLKNPTRTPLGVLALFLALVEAIAGSAVVLGDHIDAAQRWAIVGFIVAFPLLVLRTFFVLITKHHRNLYAPFEFRSDDAFLRPQAPNEVRARLIAEAEHASDESNSQSEPRRQLAPEGRPASEKTQSPKVEEPGKTTIADKKDVVPVKTEPEPLETKKPPAETRQRNKVMEVHAAIHEADQAEKYVRMLLPALTKHRILEDVAIEVEGQPVPFDAMVISDRGAKAIEVMVVGEGWLDRSRIFKLIDRCKQAAHRLATQKPRRDFSLFAIVVVLSAEGDSPMAVSPADQSFLSSASFPTAIRTISMRKLRRLATRATDDDDMELQVWERLLEEGM